MRPKNALLRVYQLIVCFALVVGMLPNLFVHADPAAGKTYRQYVESQDDFMNPERGFEYYFDPGQTLYQAAKSREAGYSIAYWNVRLDSFRNGPISEAFLTELEQGFAQVRQAGIKVQMNFAYNFSSAGEDAPKSVVLGHIDQLKPLLTTNADVIVSAQAGFIGAFGAWGTSTNNLTSPANAVPIVQALLGALPNNRMVQIPANVSKETLLPNNNLPLQPGEAFNESDRARIGYFNNNFLNDSYPAGLKQYIAADTRYTPIGGQTINNPPRSDAANAIIEMTAMHYSYLYVNWNPDVYQAWKNQGKYVEISKRLGYRFVLDHAGWTDRFRQGQTASIELDIRNAGFAAMFNPRPVYVVLDGASGRYNIPLAGVDPRRWAPGETTHVGAAFEVPANVPPGDYKLALWLPDEDADIQNRPEYAVRLANDNMWNATAGYNLLTEQVTVQTSGQNTVPVAADSAYTTWVNEALNGTLHANDGDGDALTYSIVTNGQKGTVSITNATYGTFTYTPNAGVTGTDTFTFQVNDGTASSNVGTVTLTIQSLADNPATGHGEYVESFENFLNPERGFTYYYDPNQAAFAAAQSRQKGYSIAQWNVQLDAFRNGPISHSFLDRLGQNFEEVRQAGIKVVLRFSYDFSSAGVDAPKNIVLNHINQLKPILVANADVIAVMQAGFIGAWGEWHSSANNLDQPENAGPILQAILDALPDNRMVQIRTPMKKEELYPNGGVPLQPQEAFNGSDRARIGHHNDCFLASVNDVGTYPINAVEQWKNYVAADTRYTPMGGETCAPRSSISHSDNAIPEMERLHTSYLYINWHPDVYQAWRDQGKFDEISRRFGYRFVLQDASWTKRMRPGQAASLKLNVRNAGFAAMFNPRPVYAVLDGAAGRYNIPLTGLDPRHWASGETSHVEAAIQVPANVPPGDYKLALWLPDEDADIQNRPEYAVRLANENVWDGSKGYNVLAEHLSVISPGQNTAPVAADVTFSSVQNAAVNGTLSASDDEGDPLTYSIVANGQKGTATITNAVYGTFRYTPNPGASGTDTFTFKVNDGRTDSNVATATIVMTMQASLTAELTTVSSGNTFKVKYGLSGVTQSVYGQDIKVDYDPTVMEFVSARSIREGVSLLESVSGPAGKLRLIAASEGPGQAVANNEQLLELTFRAKDVDQPEPGIISLAAARLSNETGDEFEAALSSVTVQITPGIPGDLNRDGKVSIGDVGIMASYFGKTANSSDWELVKRADLNKDGQINLLDLILLAKIMIE